ncbi:hypothetical protein GCM10007916_10050 [Psychromonas marina]|uniref:HNH endonuclease n=1 Tax=Psychromonas marina TaxID=88364 RepID=A0ABQ6DYJ5_9GAMM|nr:hypothetical protein [Psychromonas marina]GLS89938.1 hypothetical protein GCM10007916_10050 [Psychromonas marina]
MRSRIQAAEIYLSAVQKSLNIGWLETFTLPNKSLFDKLALLHPQHLEEIDLPCHLSKLKVQEKIQGKRGFPSNNQNESCNSKLIWGYTCSLPGKMQQDHLFPYSLGGPTIGANRISLCSYHNMVKSSDIHSYPWEDLMNKPGLWLDAQVERLYKDIFQLYG